MSKSDKPFLVIFGRFKAFDGDRVFSHWFPNDFIGTLEHVGESESCFNGWMVHWDNGESQVAPAMDITLFDTTGRLIPGHPTAITFKRNNNEK